MSDATQTNQRNCKRSMPCARRTRAQTEAAPAKRAANNTSTSGNRRTLSPASAGGVGFSNAANGAPSLRSVNMITAINKAIAAAAVNATGRHARETSRPSGKTKASAKGHAKRSGHVASEAAAAHRPAGSMPGWTRSATSAYG